LFYVKHKVLTTPKQKAALKHIKPTQAQQGMLGWRSNDARILMGIGETNTSV